MTDVVSAPNRDNEHPDVTQRLPAAPLVLPVLQDSWPRVRCCRTADPSERAEKVDDCKVKTHTYAH